MCHYKFQKNRTSEKIERQTGYVAFSKIVSLFENVSHYLFYQKLYHQKKSIQYKYADFYNFKTSEMHLASVRVNNLGDLALFD